MFIDIILLIIGIVLLYIGAERLVKNSSWLAKSIGVTPLIIGMTVVAFGTSAPELLVSSVASFQGNSAIAIGNVIGSNIANIGLILGIMVLIWPPKSDSQVVRREFPFLVIVSILLFVLSLDGTLGRIDGAVLISLFIVFIYSNVITVKRGLASKFKHEVVEAEEKIEAIIDSKRRKRRAIKNLSLAVLGLLILLAGSKLLVDSAIAIAARAGISQMVIGLSIVALGTSLPELFTSVIASIKKQDKISVGMVLGSNIFNTLLILGIAAMILPITLQPKDIYISLPIMILFTFMAFPILNEKIKTRRIFGLFMVLGYFGFIFYSIIS
ncbi:calcium/sodium antiporter [Patescibacteria group bacterium]|nr:calcium/sodium antiporter [Patescibacteria group bacterium]